MRWGRSVRGLSSRLLCDGMSILNYRIVIIIDKLHSGAERPRERCRDGAFSALWSGDA